MRTLLAVFATLATVLLTLIVGTLLVCSCLGNQLTALAGIVGLTTVVAAIGFGILVARAIGRRPSPPPPPSPPHDQHPHQ
jgi:hypothetical protein